MNDTLGHGQGDDLRSAPASWAQGAETIRSLIELGHLERITVDDVTDDLPKVEEVVRTMRRFVGLVGEF